MTTVEDIERAVSNLSPDDLARFRAWFDEFEANCFDKRIEADAASGKLDGLAEEALTEYREGRARAI